MAFTDPQGADPHMRAALEAARDAFLASLEASPHDGGQLAFIMAATCESAEPDALVIIGWRNCSPEVAAPHLFDLGQETFRAGAAMVGASVEVRPVPKPNARNN